MFKIKEIGKQTKIFVYYFYSNTIDIIINRFQNNQFISLKSIVLRVRTFFRKGKGANIFMVIFLKTCTFVAKLSL